MLSALWGSAFVFIKIAAPAIGAVGLVFARLVLASLLLGALFIRKEHFKMIKENIFPIILIGATFHMLRWKLMQAPCQSLMAALLFLLFCFQYSG